MKLTKDERDEVESMVEVWCNYIGDYNLGPSDEQARRFALASALKKMGLKPLAKWVEENV